MTDKEKPGKRNAKSGPHQPGQARGKERHTVKIQIWIEEVPLVDSSHLETKVFPILRFQKKPASLASIVREIVYHPDIMSGAISALSHDVVLLGLRKGLVVSHLVAGTESEPTG